MSEELQESQEAPQSNTLIGEIVEKFKTLSQEDKDKAWKLLHAEYKPNKRKRNEYDLDFKKNVVEIYKTTNNYLETTRIVLERYKVVLDESNVRRWASELLSAAEFKEIKKKPKITKRRAKYPEMEEDLTVWFTEQRKNKICVSLKMFKDQAKKIFNELKKKFSETHNEELKKYEGAEFGASSGWFKRFRRRYKISRRVPTHTAQKLTENYADEISRFIGRVRELR